MVGTKKALAKGRKDPFVKIRILATTDIHMQVLSYNYQTNKDNAEQGFARIATLIRQARKEARNTILLDNGDLLSGPSIVPSILMETKGPHPIISIMNDLGYDAATPGNHDFDFGLSYLLKALMQADFPFINANAMVQFGAETTPNHALFTQFTLLDKDVTDENGDPHKVRIGITGFLPPGSISQFESNEYQIHTRDIIDAANTLIPEMKAAGAEIIVVLAHTGIGSPVHETNMENALIPLAKVAGIDAIIAGHIHQTFPNHTWSNDGIKDADKSTIHAIPVVAPGAMGSHLGVIDLTLRRHNNSWIVQGNECTLRATSKDVPLDPVALQTITPVHEKMLDWSAQPINASTPPLTSFFAYVAPSIAVQTIQRAQTWYIETHCADYYVSDVPLLSSSCSFKTGGYDGPSNYTDIPAGPITKRGLTDLYPFNNHIAILRMNGANVMEWLERSASIFSTAVPGQKDVILKPSSIPAYFFETILELDYSIDLSQPARYNQLSNVVAPQARRIKNLTYAGHAVHPDQEFNLITNNFRQGGGGFYPVSCLKTRVGIPAQPMQAVLAAYFQAHSDLSFSIDPHWRFTPIPGARLAFRSSPKAAKYMSELPECNIQTLGTSNNGFQIFELIL